MCLGMLSPLNLPDNMYFLFIMGETFIPIPVPFSLKSEWSKTHNVEIIGLRIVECREQTALIV